MSTPSAKARRAAHAAKVAARSAQSSGVIKCYVEQFENTAGLPDLRFREKSTARLVRIVTANQLFRSFAPLSTLLQDCYGHGGGLIDPRGREEYLAIAAPIVAQSAHEITARFDHEFSAKVNIVTAGLAETPTSVWAYIEEYQTDDGGLGVRIRQKVTGRKIEIYGRNGDHLIQFLSSPRLTAADNSMPNLFEKDGFKDYVLVSGGTAVDSYDVVLFEDDANLTYLLGPTPDTAYRDAFRALNEESAAAAHSRTAVGHLQAGRYREAVLSARLAVEMACGGSGSDIRDRLTGAPADVSTAGADLQATRNLAVHEGGTRVEQPEASKAIHAMNVVLDYVVPTARPTV